MNSHDPNESPGGVALRRCIARDVPEFAELFWGRAPLLSRADELSRAAGSGRLGQPTQAGDTEPPHGFADLIDADAVDELVSRRGLRTPFLRMAKDGAVAPAGRFTRGGGAGAGVTDQVADDKVLAQIGDGSTLVLQALHRTWPPLVDFGSQLAVELGHSVQINAYVTPPQSRGFAAHYDVHDVFVLQVAGRKQWTIHEAVVTDPLESDAWENHRVQVAERAAGDEPLIDVVLEPGDALYLPRGTIHAASALGDTSIHLTVGVHPVTRHQLVKHLLDLAQDDVALRTSLPMGVELGDPAVLEPHLVATVAALRDFLDRADVDEVASRVGQRLMHQTRPEAIGPLAQLAAADAVHDASALRLRGALRHRLGTDGDRLTLILLDRTIALPADTAAALKTVLAGAVFTPAELPGLAQADRVTLARRLLREGVIVPA